MKFLFDENTPRSVPDVLKIALADDGENSFYWITDAPFHPSMKDEEIFSIITQDGEWCIVSYDKFRRHPVKQFAKDCLVILLNNAWRKKSMPERCWRFIKIFHGQIANFKTAPRGKIYHLENRGKLVPK